MIIMASSFQPMLSSGSFERENQKKINILFASINKIENVYRMPILRGYG